MVKSINEQYSPSLLEVCTWYCNENPLRPESVRGYHRVISVFIRDTGISRVSELSPELLLEWRDSVVNRCTTTSFNTYYRHLRAVLNYCVRKKILDENPLLSIRQFKRAHRRRKACSHDELEKLCQHLQSDVDNPLSDFILRAVLTLFYSGMRRSQLCGLRWHDIDFQSNTICFRADHSKSGRLWEIPLHDELHGILRQMRLEASRRFPDFSESDQVFCLQRYSHRHRGPGMSPDQFSKLLKKAAARCGVNVSSHRIRHLFASILANQDTDNVRNGEVPLTLVALKEILGHRSISTTIGYIEPKLTSQKQMLKGIKSIQGVCDNLRYGI